MIVPLGSRSGDHAHCPPIHATTPRKHFSIVITLQTYAHALPQDDAEAADRIAAAFE
jgi:hypothetical protein